MSIPDFSKLSAADAQRVLFRFIDSQIRDDDKSIRGTRVSLDEQGSETDQLVKATTDYYQRLIQLEKKKDTWTQSSLEVVLSDASGEVAAHMATYEKYNDPSIERAAGKMEGAFQRLLTDRSGVRVGGR